MVGEQTPRDAVVEMEAPTDMVGGVKVELVEEIHGKMGKKEGRIRSWDSNKMDAELERGTIERLNLEL